MTKEVGGHSHGSRECAPDDGLRVPIIPKAAPMDGGHASFMVMSL
jgi:hypothetical protein